MYVIYIVFNNIYIYTHVCIYVCIYICIIIRDNVAYEGFRLLDYSLLLFALCCSSVVCWRQHTTEEGHRSFLMPWSFYWIKVSQLCFIFVLCMCICI